MIVKIWKCYIIQCFIFNTRNDYNNAQRYGITLVSKTVKIAHYKITVKIKIIIVFIRYCIVCYCDIVDLSVERDGVFLHRLLVLSNKQFIPN